MSQSQDVRELQDHAVVDGLKGLFSAKKLKRCLRLGFNIEGDDGFVIGLYSGMQRRISSQNRGMNALWVERLAFEVLESYKDVGQDQDDSWKHDLYIARNEVYWLMFTSKVIECNANYVRLLHSDPNLRSGGKPGN